MPSAGGSLPRLAQCRLPVPESAALGACGRDLIGLVRRNRGAALRKRFLVWMYNFTVLALCFPSAASASGATPAETDAGVAYCNARERQRAVLDAAAGLHLVELRSGQGLSAPGLGDTTFETWRVERPQDYRRACNAVIGSARLSTNSSKGSGPFDSLSVLIPTIVGAALALGGGEWKASRDRRRAAADGVRTAAAALRGEGSALARAWRSALGAPATDVYFGKRDSLITAVRNAMAIRPCPLAEQLVAELSGNKATLAVEQWPGPGPARGNRQSDAERWLTAVESDANTLAAYVAGRPRWQRPLSGRATTVNIN